MFYRYYRLSGYDHLFLVKADFEEIKNNILWTSQLGILILNLGYVWCHDILEVVKISLKNWFKARRLYVYLNLESVL